MKTHNDLFLRSAAHVWPHHNYQLSENGQKASWKALYPPGLEFVAEDEGTQDLTVRQGVRAISYTENKRPYSNDCVARTSPCSVERPALKYWETRTLVRLKTSTSGTRYIESYGIQKNARSRTIVGFPENVEEVDPGVHVKDWKTAYISAITGQNVGESLANAVLQTLELKDWPETIKMIFGFVKFLGSSKANKLKRIRNLTSKDAAGAYLAWKYGVEPTIPQIKFFLREMNSGLEQARSSLTRLATNARQAVDNATIPLKGRKLRADATVSSRATLINRGDVYDKTEGFTAWQWAHNDWSEPIVLDRTYTAANGWLDRPHHEQFIEALNQRTHTYSAVVPNELIFYSTFDAYRIIESDLFTDVLGQIVDLMQPLSNLWAIFPLSFVVDWFVNMEGALQRLDLLVASRKVPPPIDGVWYSARYLPLIGTSLPYAVYLEPEIIPQYGDVDGKERIVAITVRQTYNLIGDEESSFMMPLPEGLFYDRHPVTDVSEWDLLLPNISINLNFSKVLSLGALVHPK